MSSIPITYILIGITVAVSFLALSNGNIMRALIMNPYQISTRGQYYRLITSGFIHKDHMHLLFNMISFYFFGRAVEYVFKNIFGAGAGGYYFIALYVLAILMSDLPTYFKHKTNANYNSLGASGGVAAIVFAFILFRPLDNIYIYFALPVPGFILGVGYIVYSWHQGRKSKDNINHDAHLYGALFGLVFCVLTYPPCIGQFFQQLQHWKYFENF
jgi:membrane associated rhomboid family serine protease